MAESDKTKTHSDSRLRRPALDLEQRTAPPGVERGSLGPRTLVPSFQSRDRQCFLPGRNDRVLGTRDRTNYGVLPKGAHSVPEIPP